MWQGVKKQDGKVQVPEPTCQALAKINRQTIFVVYLVTENTVPPHAYRGPFS